MPKKISDIERIIQFFMNCQEGEFNIQLEVIKAIRALRFGSAKPAKRSAKKVPPPRQTSTRQLQTDEEIVL